MEHKPTFQRIARLILLSLYGKAEDMQIQELQEWLQKDKDNQHFYENILSHSYLEKGLQEYMQYDSRDAWEQMKLKMQPKRKPLIKRLLPYAAAIAILITTIMLVHPGNPVESSALEIATAPIIRPGSSKAQLVLSDGQQIELENENNRLCRQIEGEHFLNDGKSLDYRQQASAPDSARLHTLRIPRGGEYRIVLSDGTRVWMNAESELVYPARFTGKQRSVTLKGEAYFEVARNTDNPFYVTIGDMEVKVLGTSFNVSAYPGEKRHTTLVEGNVAVTWQQQEVSVQPGQQAIEDEKGLQVKKVNVMNYIGWKERRFVYKEQNLSEVLKELERWYDVQFLMADKAIGHLHLTANLPKYENIDKVLEIISYAACVKFEIKDRTVLIRQD